MQNGVNASFLNTSYQVDSYLQVGSQIHFRKDIHQRHRVCLDAAHVLRCAALTMVTIENYTF